MGTTGQGIVISAPKTVPLLGPLVTDSEMTKYILYSCLSDAPIQNAVASVCHSLYDIDLGCVICRGLYSDCPTCNEKDALIDNIESRANVVYADIPRHYIGSDEVSELIDAHCVDDLEITPLDSLSILIKGPQYEIYDSDMR